MKWYELPYGFQSKFLIYMGNEDGNDVEQFHLKARQVEHPGHGVVQGRCLLLCRGALWCKVEGLQQHVHVCQVVPDVYVSCHCLNWHCCGHGARSAAILPHECSRILRPLDHGNLDCDLVLHFQVFDYSLLVEVIGWYPEERRRGQGLLKFLKGSMKCMNFRLLKICSKNRLDLMNLIFM